MKNIEKEFKKYVSNYDMTDSKVKLKYEHSYRVMKLSEMIAKSLCLTKKEIELAKTIGLIHDIGRFEQIKEYDSFNDNETIDHALLGCRILFQEDEIKNYLEDSNYYKTVFDAIKNHNQCELEELDESGLLFSMIVRDADKLDILYRIVFLDKSIYETSDKISELVDEDFFLKKLVKYKHIENPNDRIICDLALMYDLNFECSYEYIINNNIINKYMKKLNNKDRFKDYFNYMESFIEERKTKYAR